MKNLITFNKCVAFVIIFMFFVLSFDIPKVYAVLGEGLNSGIAEQVMQESRTPLDGTISKVTGSIIVILQVSAMAGVVFMGVKYMFAASEDKAKIKQTLIWVVVGAIFVFAAPTVINFISRISANLLRT